MIRQTGIWLDYDIANIIHLDDGVIKIEEIHSKMEHHHIGGGARSRTPWGPMDKTSESKLLARKKAQAANFFELIKKSISDSDEIYISGPAEAKVGLSNYLLETKGPKPNIIGTDTSRYLTLNQKIAKVRSVFNSREATSQKK